MIKGIGASSGLACAKVYKPALEALIIEEKHIQNPQDEITRFHEALNHSITDLTAIKASTEVSIDASTAAIFGAHIEILGDPELIGAVETKIRTENLNSDFALKSISDNFIAMFQSMDNAYLRERATDIKDVTKRVLHHIQGIPMAGLQDITGEVILVANDLTPSDTAQLDKSLVKGFITEVGGTTSHSAIMARTLGIPAIVGAKAARDHLESGMMIIMDGTSGEVILDPSADDIKSFKLSVKKLQEEKEKWATVSDKASLTKDGHNLEIGANIGTPDDLADAIDHSAECIGLFRTEFLYMDQTNFPTEDVQYKAYKTVLETMKGKPVVIRTMDIGGDKTLSYLPMEEESNPFLGNRALRLCFTKPELFTTQLRALLRASIHGNLHIMFPMIATVSELRQAKGMIEDIKCQLAAESIPYNGQVKIGIMIEIPAAAIASDQLAKEVDFFSIGTNDLIQYAFAADRMNESVSYLYQPLHPSILRLIKMVIDNAHKNGKWVGMCGEMAGEEKALPLLIGLGLDEFSMNASGILRTRYNASLISRSSSETLAEKALELATQEEVINLVDNFMRQIADL